MKKIDIYTAFFIVIFSTPIGWTAAKWFALFWVWCGVPEVMAEFIAYGFLIGWFIGIYMSVFARFTFKHWWFEGAK